jgi:hypothetical protein
MNVELVALRPMTYATRDLKKDDTFNATEVHAKLLVHAGAARRKDERAESDAEKPATDDTSAETTPPEAVVPEESGRQGRGRGRYRRRDLRADE